MALSPSSILLAVRAVTLPGDGLAGSSSFWGKTFFARCLPDYGLQQGLRAVPGDLDADAQQHKRDNAENSVGRLWRKARGDLGRPKRTGPDAWCRPAHGFLRGFAGNCYLNITHKLCRLSGKRCSCSFRFLRAVFDTIAALFCEAAGKARTVMDHHTVAAISIAGSCLDVLGSLYLAYDLLGGQHGPLRLLTRGVTYSIIFGVGYGIGLGAFFGFMSGIAVGITLAIELNRVSRGREHHSLFSDGLFASVRSLGVAIGLYPIVGAEFALLFALIITVGQVFAYSRGIRPGMDYTAARHAHLTRRQVWSTLTRTVGYFLTALLCSAVIHHVDWAFAVRVGVVTGIVTGIGQTVTPYIEYYANNMPERLMGVFGIALILCGFALQSTQYWLTLFDVRLS